MPNEIYNHVTVEGDEELLKVLDEAVRLDAQLPFDFHRIVPQPPYVLSLLQKPIPDGVEAPDSFSVWYNWRMRHWGTKWAPYHFDECRPGLYVFSTGWDPPVPVIRELSRLFPGLKIGISYQDEDTTMDEWVTFRNGRVVSHDRTL